MGLPKDFEEKLAREEGLLDVQERFTELQLAE